MGEASVFGAEDKDLMETIDMLQRTSAILEREMSKGGASMLQMKNAGSVVNALEVTTKDLAEDVAAKATLHHDCMTKAANFEAETKSRGEELKALATARKIIKEATSLAQVSFVQVASQLSTGTDLAKYEVVRFVRDLAHKERSTVLAQLASHLASAMHSRNPFGKVKDLISDMISKLEASADADATEKAY